MLSYVANFFLWDICFIQHKTQFKTNATYIRLSIDRGIVTFLM